MIDALPLVEISKTTVWRIIPSRYPPVELFRDVAPAEDWEFIKQFEGRTNERLLEGNSSRGLVRPEDRSEVSNSHYILGPLTHPNPVGSKFSDGTFGVVYAGLDFETTVAEVKAQREGFLRFTSEEPQRFDMRVIVMDLEGVLHDLRGNAKDIRADIDQQRDVGCFLREENSNGVVFDSEVRPGGECVGVFRPHVLSNCRQEKHFSFLWDGTSITEVVEYSEMVGSI